MKDLKIKRPVWYGDACILNNHDTKLLNRWFDETIEPLNKLLDGAVEVSGQTHGEWGYFSEQVEDNTIATHKALLINIEPIKKETREEKLEAILRLIIKNQGTNIYEWVADIEQALGAKDE